MFTRITYFELLASAVDKSGRHRRAPKGMISVFVAGIRTSPRVARTFLAVNNTRSPTNRVPLSRYDVEAKLYSRSVSSQPSFDFYPPGPNF